MQPDDSQSSIATLDTQTIETAAVRLKHKRTIAVAVSAILLIGLGSILFVAFTPAQAFEPTNPLDEYSGFLYSNGTCTAWITLALFADPAHVPTGKQGVKVTFFEPGTATGGKEALCDPVHSPTGFAQIGNLQMTGYLSDPTHIAAYYFTQDWHAGGKGGGHFETHYHNVLITLSYKFNGDTIVPRGSYLYYTEQEWSQAFRFNAGTPNDRDAAFSGQQ